MDLRPVLVLCHFPSTSHLIIRKERVESFLSLENNGIIPAYHSANPSEFMRRCWTMEVGVLGSRDGGCAVAFDWAKHGHDVRLFDFAKFHDSILSIRSNAGIRSEGELDGTLLSAALVCP